MKEERNIYMLTDEGWQHLETGKIVESGGIPLDAADIQELKSLHLENSEGGIMPIKSKRINLSIPPSKVPRIRDTGKKNRLHSRDGSLNDATICTELILFMCEMQSDQDKFLEEEGETLLDLIRRLLNDHAKKYRKSK